MIENEDIIKKNGKLYCSCSGQLVRVANNISNCIVGCSKCSIGFFKEYLTESEIAVLPSWEDIKNREKRSKEVKNENKI